jgi:Kdo2-lipid IVA lauroyltransferase/acyltransferase
MARRTLWRRFRRATRGPRNALLARLIWGSGRLLGALPVPVALAVGRTLGRGAHRLLGAARRLALAHVAFAFPELDAAARARVVAETFRHAGQSFAELTLFPRLRARPGYISFEGVERLDRALAAGRGAIVVTGHVGNWELLAAACSARGLPITVVGRRVNDMRFHALVTRFRQAAGLEVLVRDDPRFVSAVREALARNRVVAMLIDQDTRGAGVFVPFFGRLARTPPGPAVLALRARVPVLTVFIHRRLDGSHRIRFDDVPVGGRRTRAEVTELTARLTAAIEGAIREAPPQWVWWHERWRRRPEAADLPGIVTGGAADAIDASA